MAIPIEGFSVVVQRERLQPLLDREAIVIPNNTAVGDDDIWVCSFMALDDAHVFLQLLEDLGLNVRQGPDSDAVLVSEFEQSVEPYCEWLQMAPWERAIIAWKAGTEPRSVMAREGWDPKKGSGLTFRDASDDEDLEFVRHEDGVDVYRDRRTGEERYTGRPYVPIKEAFEQASEIIGRKWVTAGETPVTGELVAETERALKLLDKVLAQRPDFWNAWWLKGKGEIAIGQLEAARRSFLKAFELESNVSAIPRELAGVCLELGQFSDATRACERAVVLEPENAGLISNLALAYLLEGKLNEARRSIGAAIKLDSEDKINQFLLRAITEVIEGKRALPKSLAELQG